MAAGTEGVRGLLALLVLGVLAAGGQGTSPDIQTQFTSTHGKLVLSCNLTEPHSAIDGHEWKYGDKILQTDTESSSVTTYDTWTWSRNGEQSIINGSGRYIIKSSGNKTELRILKLNIEEDTGDYQCIAINVFGTGEATVNLRVRSRLAALWPFLGIVAEVLVLVTIIFIYEKRRKPDEVLDDDDGGSAPLKSNATNHKDKNVRQRNAN